MRREDMRCEEKRIENNRREEKRHGRYQNIRREREIKIYVFCFFFSAHGKLLKLCGTQHQ